VTALLRRVIIWLLATYGEAVLAWTLAQVIERVLGGSHLVAELPVEEPDELYFWDAAEPCDWEDPCH
jgi:hypothetical protein